MSSRPLEGIRVLDFAAYISGPYAGALLASLGAEVVKIEPPSGEAFRIGMNAGSPFFGQYNAGKKSVVVNLKDPDGVAVVKSMLPSYDVLLENMRPGKMDALGLGAKDCRAINPGMVYVSVSGFGNGGEWRDRPAYDSIGQALGGFYTLMNDVDQVRLTGTCFADLITAINVALGVVSALLGRERDPARAGTHIETSVFEATTTLTIDALTQAVAADIDPIRETRHPQAQNFCLRTASDDYIVLHLSSSQKFWRKLMQAVGREEVADDPLYATYAERVKPERFAALKALLEQEFLKQTRDEWERRLVAADVPFSPALTMRQVATHPQAQYLGVMGEGTLVNPPWRLDGERPQRDPHVPEIGEDTREVLSEFVEPARLDELLERGVVGVRAPALG